MAWYVIFVETGYEEDVCLFVQKRLKRCIEEITYQLLVPKRKIYERKQGVRREVTKLLFPGYILLETDEVEAFFIATRGFPHILKFLRNQNLFLVVQPNEINLILEMVDKRGLISISKAFAAADKVHITDGPLAGREGIIRKIDKRKGRAKVEFEWNSKTLLIDLGIDIFQKAEE